MPQATIIPTEILPLKDGKFSQDIRDENGGYWGIHPGSAARLQIGVPVTVDYQTRIWNNKTFYNIKSIVGQQTRPEPVGRSASGLTSRNFVQPSPAPDVKKAEDIFVTTVVQAAIAKDYPIEERQLTLLVQMARTAWRTDREIASNEPPFPGSPDDYGDIPDRG